MTLMGRHNVNSLLVVGEEGKQAKDSRFAKVKAPRHQK